MSLTTIPPELRIKALGWLWPQFDELAIRDLLESYEKLGAAWGADYWNGLVGSFRGETITGVAWAEPQAGRVAAIHGPRLASREPPATARQLVARAVECATAFRVRLMQSLKDPADHASKLMLIDNGFRHLGDLLFLRADCTTEPPKSPAISLHLEPYSATTQARFSAVIERTYVGSLDCPAVDGLRSVAEVLEGYRATGVFDPNRWLIASAELNSPGQRTDVGCLLLSEQPLTQQWELMYMGIVPEGRGRGWGLDLVRHAQRLARSGGARSVVLAVDTANEPGLAMYAAAGFREFDRRALYLRVLDTPRSSNANAGIA